MFLLTKDCKYYFSMSYSTDEEISKEKRQTCFEVDELIVPIIQLLNQKGYKTIFSCAGHYFKNALEDIDFDDNIEYSDLKFIDDNEEGNGGWSIPYIMFDKDIDLPNIDTLPKKWYIEYFPENIEDRLKLSDENGMLDYDLLRKKPDNKKYLIGLYCNIDDIVSRSKIDGEVDLYKFYIKLINRLRKMYTWVKMLPENKKKD